MASYVADNIGIRETYSELLPEDKMKIIKRYSDNNEPVCMIGDGVNDALALASADAGIAMEASDQTLPLNLLMQY